MELFEKFLFRSNEYFLSIDIDWTCGIEPEWSSFSAKHNHVLIGLITVLDTILVVRQNDSKQERLFGNNLISVSEGKVLHYIVCFLTWFWQKSSLGVHVVHSNSH